MAVSDLQRFTLERISENDRIERNDDDESGLTDESIVEFEGQQCRWGDLTLADRKAYWQDGYPF
jgi:hypothetical protein